MQATTPPSNFRRRKLVPTSNGAQRRIDDYHLSRYATTAVTSNHDSLGALPMPTIHDEVMAAYQCGRHSPPRIGCMFPR